MSRIPVTAGDHAPVTAGDHAAEAIRVLPAHRLGLLLRTRRNEAHLEAPAAARAVGIAVNVLDDIESGRITPQAAVLGALLKCYGVAPADFVPPRTPLTAPRSDATTDEVLRGYVDAVRGWRNAGGRAKLNFRANDIIVLGEALGADPGEIERRLIAVTGCSPSEARLLRKWLLAILVTIPVAAGVIGTGAASATAATQPGAPSHAAGSPAATLAQGSVTPGSLTLAVGAPKLGAAQVDGRIQLTENYLITDARGSGSGWTVQAAFTSSDATADPIRETLDNVNGEPTMPQTPALPATLTSAPVAIVRAEPGTEGMGSFAGELELDISSQSNDSSGALTITFAPPASA